MSKRNLTFVIMLCLLAAALAWLPSSNVKAVTDPHPAYPRLGMWWPNPWEQSLDDIARYDWVILGDWSAEFIDPLKARNPDILLLNSTNACELGFDPDDPASRAYMSSIPAEWFLTQVGTTLRAAVNATQTVLPVQALTVSNGTETFDLFVPGDAALIDGESVYVQSVDKVNRTITVQRGYVRQASAHAAATRIAAHVSFWPQSWVMNLSTLSPLGTFDPLIGPERWGDYNARAGAELLADPRWDGILIDRSDGEESWLVGNSTARTLDPNQSNTLPADYSNFDQTWNDGLYQYEADLRGLVGLNKIIFTNWGEPNYALLNGNNFEGFPKDDGASYGSAWHTTVFGPWPDAGSYFDWLQYSGTPNLSMIETYEDDSGADPNGDGYYDNPCVKLGFVPNYRKMRFGLGTALLGDGYYSYEINTNGHGSLCLLWFDEYDNAGAGRGYLGYPTGAAIRAFDSLPTPDLLLATGGFESQADLDAWSTWADTGYGISASLDAANPNSGAKAVRLDVPLAQGTDWQASFSYEPLALTLGQDYTLTFWARADKARPLSMWAQQNHEPWQGWLDFGQVQLTTEWQQYTISTSAAGSDTTAFLAFGLGETTGSVWLDDVRLQAGSQEVWRRDYDHGIVLVNASGNPATIPLETGYFKIQGAQVPNVNNGAYVTQVNLPARDAVILLKAGLFADVHPSYWSKSWIERLYNAGVTGGCGKNPLVYCPSASVTRDQMAVFILRSLRGDTYVPPEATGTVFSDVPSSHWAANWIEALQAEGITGGCGGGRYCPSQPVTRAEMAVFLLRATHGSTFIPPTASGTKFTDIPSNHWAAAWIEQLAAEGITGGCGGGKYCPNTPVTRGQMAVFLVETFNLP